MKRITLLILGFFILTSNLQAEIICLKSSKKAKVVNDKVTIKAPKFITVATGSCPAGYVFLTDLDKAPVTQTGVWNMSGGAGETYAAAQISFPTKLQSSPTSVVFVEAGTTDSTCTGTVNNPTAPEGVLCIYEDYSANLQSPLSTRYFMYNAVDGGTTSPSGASIYGGALYGYVDIFGGSFYAWGTWAMTQTPTTIL